MIRQKISLFEFAFGEVLVNWEIRQSENCPGYYDLNLRVMIDSQEFNNRYKSMIDELFANLPVGVQLNLNVEGERAAFEQIVGMDGVVRTMRGW